MQNLVMDIDKALDKLEPLSGDIRDKRKTLLQKLENTPSKTVETDSRTYSIIYGTKKPTITLKLLNSVSNGSPEIQEFITAVKSTLIDKSEKVPRLQIKNK